MIKSLDSIEEFTNKEKKLSKKEHHNMVFQPKIAVLGIGGAGTNAINNLLTMDLVNIKFIVANTDLKSLNNSNCPNKIHLGLEITKGLGAGSNPEIAFKAAEKSTEDIIKACSNIDLLFLIAGMGGGTGTGASPVIAKIAKELNILTLGFVTKPFHFEGTQRMLLAENGIKELEKHVDSIVVMCNQNLFKIVNEKTSMLDAFRITDSVIFSGIKAISDLITANGMVNLDFNDIKLILSNGGKTVVTSAEVTGSDKITKITESIMNNPLIDDNIDIMNAKNILISIAGSLNMTLFEVDNIINSLRQKAHKSTYLNFGAIFDKNMTDNIRVSVIANGILSEELPEVTTEEFDDKQDVNNPSISKSIMNEVLKEESVNNNSPLQQESFIVEENYKCQDISKTHHNYGKYSREHTTIFKDLEVEDKCSSDQLNDLNENADFNKEPSLIQLIDKVTQKNMDVNKSSNSASDNFDNHLQKNKVHNKNKDTKHTFILPDFLKQKK